METIGQVIVFESDDEFADFCIAPFASVQRSEDGHLSSVKPGYSEAYQKAIEEGKKFVIKDKNSAVFKHKYVTKRVPVVIEGDTTRSQRTTFVQLEVQNLMDYYSWWFLQRKRSKVGKNGPKLVTPHRMNAFAEKYLEKYKNYWRMSGHALEGLTPSLFQRYCVPENTIPIFEVGRLFRKPTEGRLAVLFVNSNPSGTDNDYYESNNSKYDDFFYYDKTDNPYFKSTDEFYRALGLTDNNYAMIDLFPIVLNEQAVLKNAYEKNRDLFVPLIDIFVEAVEELQPQVIVVTNAFVRDVLKKEMPKFKENQTGVYYEMATDRSETAVFCGGMIAGRHQMDIESKKRLKRDVKKYLNAVFP